METVVRGMPLEYPPKPERLNAYGKRQIGQCEDRITECEGKSQIAGRGYGEPREGVAVCLSLFLSLPRTLILLFPCPSDTVFGYPGQSAR